jgi:hypothetical protein
MLQRKYIYILLIIALGAMSQCQRSRKSVGWDIDALVPLATSDLSLSHLLPDSIVVINPDNSIALAYHQTLYESTAGGIAKLPDTTLSKFYALQDLTLAADSVSRSISLGQICETGGITGATIIANNGDSLIVPTLNTTASNSNDIDGSSLFQSAQIVKGTMEISITNEFPIELKEFIYSLKNKSDGSLIVLDTFHSLLANGTTVTHSVDLAGKKVEGAMVGTILNIASPGSNGEKVLIDTSQKSIVHIKVSGVQVSAISAIFPAKDLLDFDYSVKANLKDIELKRVRIKKGQLVLTALSTLSDNLKVRISNTKATRTGAPLDEKFLINKGSSGTYATSTTSIDFAGYELDLSGPLGNDANTFSNHIVAAVEYTGLLSTLTSADSLKIYFELKGFEAEWGQGYFGKYNKTFGPTTVKTKIFDKIKAGKLMPEKLEVALTFENGAGIDGYITINNVSTARDGKVVDFSGAALTNPIYIAPATDNPHQPVIVKSSFNEQNSNILDIISALPTEMSYKFNLDLNPLGNNFKYDQFFYDTSRFKVGIEVKMPLAVLASGIHLVDTIDFSWSGLREDQPLNSALMKLVLENGYPLEAIVRMRLLDGGKNVIDSFFYSQPGIIATGLVNASQPWVCQPTKSTLVEFADRTRIDHLKQVKKAVIDVTFNTRPGREIIYDHWLVKVKLVADINYTVGGKK